MFSLCVCLSSTLSTVCVTQYMQFREVFQDRETQVRLVRTALTAIRTSEALHLFLKILLAFGNYMNANTSKGKAYGFDLHAFALVCM